MQTSYQISLLRTIEIYDEQINIIETRKSNIKIQKIENAYQLSHRKKIKICIMNNNETVTQQHNKKHVKSIVYISFHI